MYRSSALKTAIFLGASLLLTNLLLGQNDPASEKRLFEAARARDVKFQISPFGEFPKVRIQKQW
jgi:hypothetical protein